jgi:uncharacterized membrane protein YccF (DUF307 family)
MFRLLGNILWFVLGGFVMGLMWFLLGVLAFITIIGIPWSRACFVIAGFAFWPFGKEPVNRKDVSQRDDVGTGALGFLGNVIWFFLAGIWLAVGHLVSAVACFVTIIGIPFGIQHIKLAVISLAPIGQTIVDSDSLGKVGK